MECLGEEIIDGDGNVAESKQQRNEEFSSKDLSTVPQQIDSSLVDLKSGSGSGDRKLSFESQASISVAPPKSPRHSKSRNSLSSRGQL